MKSEIEELLRKMERVIASADYSQVLLVERYLSLCNRRLNKVTSEDGLWGVIGASMGLAERFKTKFDKPFIPQHEPIVEVVPVQRTWHNETAVL